MRQQLNTWMECCWRQRKNEEIRPCDADNCTEFVYGKETRLPTDNLYAFQKRQWEKRNKRKEIA